MVREREGDEREKDTIGERKRWDIERVRDERVRE